MNQFMDPKHSKTGPNRPLKWPQAKQVNAIPQREIPKLKKTLKLERTCAISTKGLEVDTTDMCRRLIL